MSKDVPRTRLMPDAILLSGKIALINAGSAARHGRHGKWRLFAKHI